jgi:hypothetical protein
MHTCYRTTNQTHIACPACHIDQQARGQGQDDRHGPCRTRSFPFVHGEPVDPTAALQRDRSAGGWRGQSFADPRQERRRLTQAFQGSARAHRRVRQCAEDSAPARMPPQGRSCIAGSPRPPASNSASTASSCSADPVAIASSCSADPVTVASGCSADPVTSDATRSAEGRARAGVPGAARRGGGGGLQGLHAPCVQRVRRHGAPRCVTVS